jgi:peptide/nickel transport system substrate-binding protein
MENKADQLTISIAKDPASPLNIYKSSDSSYDFLTELVYDKLFAPSPYVEQPEPWLAESIVKINSSVWDINLRNNISWHDGAPFTAEDVEFAFEYYRDGVPNRHSHHVSEAPRIEQIDVLNSSSVRFSCAYPCPTLGNITLADLPILPKHIWEKVTEPLTFNQLPIGTGPYKLAEYKPGQFFRFESNQNYFKGAPLVKELVVPIIKEPSTTFTALKTGEIDIAARPLPPELIQEFDSLPDIDLIHTTPLSFVELRLNYEIPPLDQPEFRSALSLAIDRQELVDKILLGEAKPGIEGYPHPNSPWTNPNLETPFNRTLSAQLLDELGYKDSDVDGIRELPNGDPIQFTLKVTGTEPVFVRAAEMISNQLSEVGIKISIQTLDSGLISSLFSSRDFDMYIIDATPHAVADPDQFVMSHLSGYLWKKGLAYPEWDALLEKWKQTDTVEERKKVLFEMQELFNRQPTSIVLWYPEETWAYRTISFSLWEESPGFGIVHKWSLLQPDILRNTTIAK